MDVGGTEVGRNVAGVVIGIEDGDHLVALAPADLRGRNRGRNRLEKARGGSQHAIAAIARAKHARRIWRSPSCEQACLRSHHMRIDGHNVVDGVGRRMVVGLSKLPPFLLLA